MHQARHGFHRVSGSLRRWCSTTGGDGGDGYTDTYEHGEAAQNAKLKRQFKEYIKQERAPVPRQHPDTVRMQEAEDKARMREMKELLETPRNIPAYIVPEDEVVSAKREGDLIVPLPRSSSSTLPAKAEKPSRFLHVRRYRRYKKCLQEFKDLRVKNRVAKLQRVVHAGLATEAAYQKELLRLRINPKDFPLPFKPNAYLRNDSSDTIRAFLKHSVEVNVLGGGAEDGSGGGESAAAARHYRILEGLLSETAEAREEWLSLQEQVTRVKTYLKNVDGIMGTGGPRKVKGRGEAATVELPARHAGTVDYKHLHALLRNEMYFETVRNVLARRSAFYAAHGIDPLSPSVVDELNASAHAKLFAAFAKAREGGPGAAGALVFPESVCEWSSVDAFAAAAERRVAEDGVAYTREEFDAYYAADGSAADKWEAAEAAPAKVEEVAQANLRAMPPPSSSGFDDLLEERSQASFWAMLSGYKRRRDASTAVDAAAPEGAEAVDKVSAEAAGGGKKALAKTRQDWLAENADAWRKRGEELAVLKEQRAEREAENAPDYQMVYTAGDMGLTPASHPDAFSNHPAIEYSIDEPVSPSF
eukprot:Rhum_TRINITY_DN23445_c0_g1::Rhum_TRINITY_DN23445_c0_g1_i1::g.178025::m.178025